MVANKKDVKIVVLIAMLSCFSSVSSFFAYPRVSHTPDAIVIDFAGSGFAPSPIGGRGYSQIAGPGYVPLNPYPLEQPTTFYNGWPYFRQATPAQTQCGRGPIATPTSRSLVNERVVGGAPAKKNTWSFLVVLNMSFLSSSGQYCSGTLISATKVLTAASCFEKLSLLTISSITVSIGGYLPDQSDVPMTRRISQVVIHSQYNRNTFANDIAIITLDMPVVFSKTIGPVCLPPASTDPDDFAGKQAVIIGGGQGINDDDILLQQGLVAIAYNGDCKGDPTVGKFMTNSTSCLTSSDGTTLTKFTCLNDVGGPVLINSAPNVQGTTAVWTQVGINSYTEEDCATNGLKTRVSAFIPWIASYNV